MEMPNSNQSYLERLAALESEFKALDRRHDDAEEINNKRHEANVRQAVVNKNEIIEAIGKVETKVDKINGRVGTLWDDKNKRDGAFGAGKMLAGLLGGIIGGALEFFAHK